MSTRRAHSFLLFLLLGTLLIIANGAAQAHNPLYANAIPVPVASAPAYDGVCGFNEYTGADTQTFTSFYGSSGFPVTVYTMRTASYLYICFNELPRGDASPGDFAAVYIDRDHDGGTLTRSDDYQLKITQTGTVSGGSGNSAGGYTGPNPAGWSALRNVGEFFWDAEFRISQSTVSGWGNVIGMSFAHHWVRFVGNDYAWPTQDWSYNSPNTWAHFGLFRVRLNVPGGAPATLDGVCNSSEYQDANTATFTSFYGTSAFTVNARVKHDRSYFWVCFDQLPRGDASPGDYASVYLDPNHDGGGIDGDDVWLRIAQSGTETGNSGSGGTFSGPNPGGWDAARTVGEFFWDAEFRINRDLVGGWGNVAGFGLLHEWVRSVENDFGWPSGLNESNPDTWGDAVFEIPSMLVTSGSAPVFNGTCSTAEYADATHISFISRYFGTPYTVNGYLKHTASYLYICLDGLPRGLSTPGDFTSVYLDRDNDRLPKMDAADYRFSISQTGTKTGLVGNGSGSLLGPDPGGWDALIGGDDFFWDAEFRINRTRVGGWGRTIGIALMHHWVTAVGDDYTWSNTSIWNSPNSWGQARLLTGSSATNNDLKIDAIEVTQAIQDLNNSVPLIATKPTVVRVHVAATQANAPGVTARLYGKRNGVSLGSGLFPTNAGGRITVPLTPDRGQIDDSFYFVLPWNWIQAGNLALEVQINNDLVVDEVNVANNSASTTVNFITSPPLRLKVVPIRYTIGPTTYEASGFHQQRLFSWLARAYPIPYVVMHWQTLTYDRNELPNVDRVNSQLNQMRSLDLAAGGDARTVYYGMVDDGGGFMRGKSAGIPANRAAGPTGPSGGWDTDGSYGDWYGGHEIGHTRNRKHAEFCGAGGGASYPYPSGRISPADGRFYGFDTLNNSVYGPDWTDVMTYCDFEWISDFTYNGIRNYLVSHDRAAERAVAVKGEYVAVFGTLNLLDDALSLDPFVRLTDPSSLPERVPGDYSIVMLDANDQPIVDYPFTPVALEAGPPEPGTQPTWSPPTAQIGEVVPFAEQTAAIAILHNGTELGRRTVSAHAPQVTLTKPNSGGQFSTGTIDVAWTASDADNDPLTFSLQYSPNNGASWSTLAVGLTATSYSLPVADLPGSNSARLRVIASDGLLTAIDMADQTFVVGNKPPTALILAPEDGATYLAGQTVILQGFGLDLEDGTLTDGALAWSTDIDGALGSGASLPAVLSPGTHVVTLTVEDGNGVNGVATITVHVAADDAAAGAAATPNADPGIAVSPAGQMIILDAQSNSAQFVVTVRDSSGAEFDWSASDDQPWLSVAPTSGSAPGSFTVTVNRPQQRAGNTYHGTVTVSAGGIGVPPQTIPVTLYAASTVPTATALSAATTTVAALWPLLLGLLLTLLLAVALIVQRRRRT